MKVIPEDYYKQYFSLMNSDTLKDEDATMKIFWDLEFLLKEDSPELQVFLQNFSKDDPIAWQTI